MKFKKLLAMILIMSLILGSMGSTALANNEQANDGLWNKGAGEATDYGKQYAGMENIVKPVLENGYPVINVDDASKKLTDDQGERNWELIKDWKLSGECEAAAPNQGWLYNYVGNNIQNLSQSLLANWTANDSDA